MHDELGIEQKHSRPNHPITCGKVERFRQTMKKWLTDLHIRVVATDTGQHLRTLTLDIDRGYQPRSKK